MKINYPYDYHNLIPAIAPAPHELGGWPRRHKSIGIACSRSSWLATPPNDTCAAIQYYSSKHGAVDGVRVWLPCAYPSAGAIRREYATTLGELLTHRSGLGGELLIN